jgi:diketogulonate reductase-like aldo/keto reductase
MELKQLGRSEVMLSEIGMGFWRYRGDVEAIRKGIELGATLLDTAEEYGTEELVGPAVTGIRDQAFVATKVSGRNLRHDDVLGAAEASLTRLGINVIDLYQIHWPNPAVPIRETMRAMEKLVDRGLVRFIGVSQFSLADLGVALNAMRNYPIVANQVRYNLNARTIEMALLPYCEEHQITLIAYTPLDDGRLAGRMPSGSSRRVSVLEGIAREISRTPAQVALNWCTAHPAVIAIPKSSSSARIAENCSASGWRLSRGQIDRLNRAFSWNLPWLRSKGGGLWRKVRGQQSVLNQQALD